jgi:hypothetical protein
MKFLLVFSDECYSRSWCSVGDRCAVSMCVNHMPLSYGSDVLQSSWVRRWAIDQSPSKLFVKEVDCVNMEMPAVLGYVNAIIDYNCQVTSSGSDLSLDCAMTTWLFLARERPSSLNLTRTEQNDISLHQNTKKKHLIITLFHGKSNRYLSRTLGIHLVEI